MNSDFSAILEKIKNALVSSLPLTPTNGWQEKSFGTLPEAVKKEHLSALITPCRSLLDLGGKRWRPLLLVLMAELVRSSSEKKSYENSAALSEDDTYKITPLVEFVHTASLIHDDIEDCADMRRGKPAAHITYGLDQALNAASWLYFEAAACLETLPLSKAAKSEYYLLYTNELRRLHLGQAMDISWHNHPDFFPSADEYFAMTKCKTGTLSSLAAQTGVLAGGGDRNLSAIAGSIAAEIGIGFQILDDVQNLTTGNPGKKRGDDIVEGKKSLPVLLHTEKFPDDKKTISGFFNSARKNGISDGSVEKCISLLSGSGSIQAAKEKGILLITEKSFQLAEICGKENPAAEPIKKLFSQLAKPFLSQNSSEVKNA